MTHTQMSSKKRDQKERALGNPILFLQIGSKSQELNPSQFLALGVERMKPIAVGMTLLYLSLLMPSAFAMDAGSAPVGPVGGAAVGPVEAAAAGAPAVSSAEGGAQEPQSGAGEGMEPLPPPPPLVRTINIGAWESGADYLRAHPGAQSYVILQTFVSINGVPVTEWEFRIERNANGSFSDVTLRFGEEKARSPHD